MALQRGIIDGVDTYLWFIEQARLYEVQRHVNLTKHVYTPAFLVSGQHSWSRQGSGTRELLLGAARSTQAFTYREAARRDEQIQQQLREQGVELVEVDAERFAEAARSVYDDFAKEVPNGGAILSRALSVR